MAALCHVLEWVYTRLQWVLDVQHRWPVSVQHAFQHFVFGHVRAAIFYSDARLQVVKMAAVQFEELDQQDAHVGVRTAHILSVV